MALLSFNAFNQLREKTQLTLTLMQGTFLAKRFDEEGNRFSLYYMDTFFVEVYYDDLIYQAHRCHSFVSTAPLETYLAWIRLPNL
ncbi:hypothetical protein [uncultured Hymenobacter sp.]|uniref:hypothetical protein n=1 Tax=uncultured Hymenobacter sp. TaxID=170016 RepID=UPI0035CC597A